MTSEDHQENPANARPPAVEQFGRFTKDEIDAALFPPDPDFPGEKIFVAHSNTGWNFYRKTSEDHYARIRRCNTQENDRLREIWSAVRLKCIDYRNGGDPVPIVVFWEPRT